MKSSFSTTKVPTPIHPAQAYVNETIGEEAAKQLYHGAKPTECNCRSTNCIQLYCECFFQCRYCGSECTCKECFNVPSRRDEIEQRVRKIAKRNRRAFIPTITADDSKKRHTGGCKCQKTACQKKYCPCFQSGLPCNSLCGCIGCKNTPNDVAQQKQQASEAKLNSQQLQHQGQFQKHQPLHPLQSPSHQFLEQQQQQHIYQQHPSPLQHFQLPQIQPSPPTAQAQPPHLQSSPSQSFLMQRGSPRTSLAGRPASSSHGFLPPIRNLAKPESPDQVLRVHREHRERSPLDHGLVMSGSSGSIIAPLKAKSSSYNSLPCLPNGDRSHGGVGSATHLGGGSSSPFGSPSRSPFPSLPPARPLPSTSIGSTSSSGDSGDVVMEELNSLLQKSTMVAVNRDSGKRMILLKNPSPPMRFSPYSPNSENPHLQYPPTLSPIVNPQPGPGTLPGPSAVSSPPLEVLSSPLRKTHSPTSSKSPLLTLAESTTLPPPFSPLAGGAPSPLSQHTSPQKSPSPTDQIMVVRRGGEQPPQNLSTSKSLVFPKKQERVMSPLGQIASSNLN